jgi:hypothetical protein
MPAYINKSEFQTLALQSAGQNSQRVLFIGNLFFDILKEVVCYTTNNSRHIRFAISKPVDGKKNRTHFCIFELSRKSLRIHIYLTRKDLEVLPQCISDTEHLQVQSRTRFKIINSNDVANLEAYQILGLAMISYNSRIQK